MHYDKKLFSHSAVFALFVMGAVFALVSCEKPFITDENESGTTKGNLRVSVFQIEKTPFASLSRATASEVCTRLNFAMYNKEGARVKQVNQTSDMADFGHASFQLEEGTYQLVVVGHSANGNPTMTNPAKIQFTNSTGYTDTFLCYGEVTIGEDAVDLQVALDRIVALCRFVVTDDIPADVRKMQFYYGGLRCLRCGYGLGQCSEQADGDSRCHRWRSEAVRPLHVPSRTVR